MEYGIIVAVPEEMEAMEQTIKVEKKKDIYDLTFVEGKVKNKKCVIVKCGVGKVNAARVTQLLIDRYQPKYIINVGVAGGLDPSLQIGDIVVGNQFVQHDFDITAFGHTKGYIPKIGDTIQADPKLLEKMDKLIKEKENGTYQIQKGTITSGDIFCTEIQMKDKIYTKFQAKCVEMEGAAIAQVCQLCNIPCLVIRSISDTPNGKNEQMYEQFVKLAAQRSSHIVKEFIEI